MRRAGRITAALLGVGWVTLLFLEFVWSPAQWIAVGIVAFFAAVLVLAMLAALAYWAWTGDNPLL